ncbi:hypothetical protein V1514DRAFT_334122 [Lipomyces japonicus]|uniref:uncharacterized protein n=1 Tax=Lipomyces japonicus TaxID=56871 RepID=UPI0034CE5558
MGNSVARPIDRNVPVTYNTDGDEDEIDNRLLAAALKPPSDDPKQRLQQLLRANHVTYAVLYNNHKFHNHVPHHLGSAYFLGANAKQLYEIFENTTSDLERWKEDNPAEVTINDWRDFYSQRIYQKGYNDFFSDEVMEANYNWRKIILKYLLVDDAKLLNGLISGLGHPLIHTAYAFELDSAEVAIEALTLGITNYSSSFGNLIDEFVANHGQKLSSRHEQEQVTDPVVLLDQIRLSQVFDKLKPDLANEIDLTTILNEFPNDVAYYLHKLDISDLDATIKRLFRAASLLLTATHQPGNYQFDFVLVHALTVSNAVLNLLSQLPDRKHQVSLAGQLWTFLILTYLTSQRPVVSQAKLLEYHDSGHEARLNWQHVTELALSGKWRHDAHYVKAIRALKTLDEIHNHQDPVYLRQAVFFATEFNGWIFGTSDADKKKRLDVKII